MNRGGRDALTGLSQVMFENVDLVAGSVETSQGHVIRGNGEQDDGVSVELGALEGLFGSAVIRFQARLHDGLVTGESVQTQGRVLWQAFANPEILTDDPATPAAGDATVTVVGPLLSIFNDDFESGDTEAWSLSTP